MAKEITFSYGLWHKDLLPIEWLEEMAGSFLGLADLWDEYYPGLVEDTFEDVKSEFPKFSKIEIYNEMAERFSNSMGPFHLYYFETDNIAQEIKHLKPLIVQAFEKSAIFPVFYKAFGIIISVVSKAKFAHDDYESCFYYQICSTAKEAEEWFSKGAAKRFDKKRKITAKNFENAFEIITHLLKEIENNHFSELLREAGLSLTGYCMLKAGAPKRKTTNTQFEKLLQECNEISSCYISAKMLTNVLRVLLDKNSTKADISLKNKYSITSGTVGSCLSALYKLGYLDHSNETSEYSIKPKQKSFLSNCLLDS